MKGIFNNILLLACAGVLSNAMSVPLKRDDSHERFVQFNIGKSGMSKDEMTKYRNEIEAVFMDSDSETNKAFAALYCLQELYDENESYACESNVYNKYLAKSHSYSGSSKKAAIKAGIAQFKYLCTRNMENDYCRKESIFTVDKVTDYEYACNIKSNQECRNAFVDFAKALPSEDIKDIAVTTNYNRKILINVKVNGIKSSDIKSIEKYCEKGVKPGFNDDDDDVKISTNGRCGKEYGDTVCPDSECCSKHGYCGHSSDHCKVSRGCQSEFGQCNGTATTTTKVTKTKTTTKKSSATNVSKNGRCGVNYGVCPEKECCSTHGYCGRSDDHCKVSRGCQSEFGQCNGTATTKTTKVTKTTKATKTKTTKKATSTPVVSKNGKCGSKNNGAVCPSGECCSTHGWCGTTENHCKKSQGCQSEFGKCQ